MTASDSGIGRATAVALAADGYDVGITWHRDVDDANETAAEVRSLGRRAEVRQLDLSQRLPDAVDVVDDLGDALGGLYVLVNNAGMSKQGPALELSYGAWRPGAGEPVAPRAAVPTRLGTSCRSTLDDDPACSGGRRWWTER